MQFGKRQKYNGGITSSHRPRPWESSLMECTACPFENPLGLVWRGGGGGGWHKALVDGSVSLWRRLLDSRP